MNYIGNFYIDYKLIPIILHSEGYVQANFVNLKCHVIYILGTKVLNNYQ